MIRKTISSHVHAHVSVIEGFSHEEKWLNVLFLTEGEARVGNITLIPRPKAEVLMKVYHISELENRILQRPSV